MKKLFFIFLLLLSNFSSAIEIISPHSVGGPSDRMSRILQEHLGKDYQIVYKPGAASQIAINYLNETKENILLFYSIQTFVSTDRMQESTLNIVKNNLDVLGSLSIFPTILFCNASTGIKTFDDLFKYDKPLSFGTTGVGTGDTYNTEILFKILSNKSHVKVPYSQGGTKFITDLIGNHINCMFAPYAVHNTQISNKKLNAIVVSHPVKENIPTWDELNLPESKLVTNIIGLAISKDMSTDTKNKILKDISNVFKSQEFKEKILNAGFIPFLEIENFSYIDKINKETINYLKILDIKNDSKL